MQTRVSLYRVELNRYRGGVSFETATAFFMLHCKLT